MNIKDVSRVQLLTYAYKLHKYKFPHITRQQHHKICKAYNRFLVEKLFEGETIHIPGNLGTLRISCRERIIKYDSAGNPTNMAPNWQETVKLWAADPEAKANKKLVYYVNISPYSFRFLWSRKGLSHENKDLYYINMKAKYKHRLKEVADSGRVYQIENKKFGAKDE